MAQTINLNTLRNSFLFKDVEMDVLQKVARHCQPMTLDAGETLFEQDTPPDAMYFLEDGQIHIVRRYPDGYEVILATEVPYYIIGELSLIANQPRTGSVIAVGDCDLIRISRQAILEICETIPEVAVKALTHLGNRLYQLNLRVRESAVGNVAARVASVLLLLCNNENGMITSEVSITRLARATAMDADVVERLLRQWSKQDIITVHRQQITVHSVEALRNLAG